jgi:siroheme synthase-like protein
VLETERQPQWLQERYCTEHLNGVTLAIAAATDTVNRQVAAEAKVRGIWVNIADDPDGSDFHLPAVVRSGELLIGVSTGGLAPALCKAIREHLEQDFDEAFAEWLRLIAELRPRILSIRDAGERERLFAVVTLWQWVEIIRAEGMATVRTQLTKEVSRCEALFATPPGPPRAADR